MRRIPTLSLVCADALLAQSDGGSVPLFVGSALMLGLLCAAGLLFALVSRIRRRRTRPVPPVPRESQGQAKSPNQKESAVLDLSGRERDELLENARLLARDNPAKTANLLRSWLKDD